MSKKKDSKKQKPKVKPELDGLDLNVNEFGEITSTMGIEKINEFLDKNLYDKKLDNLSEGEEEEKK
ncbi:MAG: hypothetical protein AAF740_02815 [Bacteroidota bacterium]